MTAQLEGGYTLLGDLETSVDGEGQVIGSFSTFFASEANGAAEARDFTDIRTATTIFASMHFAAERRRTPPRTSRRRRRRAPSGQLHGAAQSAEPRERHDDHHGGGLRGRTHRVL